MVTYFSFSSVILQWAWQIRRAYGLINAGQFDDLVAQFPIGTRAAPTAGPSHPPTKPTNAAADVLIAARGAHGIR
ncbi:hypothetical protein [Mycobacterium gastri]|uniref:Uncharacterized protein n=1 Tax=Mycobacterium gastri TaxID=1777 RepID=A0A1X1UTS1_MYCGS|nr:hypothetical protein [Mycobacterium gastri]ETW22026.1 hypothetical protein MGAST_22445 [Mycobacterium gastri 'Wayne']ORV60078.1 hypothetical protein AWC07_18875 [Mycobacterium gastri]